MNKENGKTLPEGWCRATVGDVAEYINGAAFKPTDWTADGMPIIRIQNLTDPSKQPNRTHRKVDPRLLICEGDLLFSWSATLDAFLWHGEDAWLNQHIFKVVPEKPLSTRFVFYLLRFAVREITRSEHMHGSTMQHINRGPFLSHCIGLPPLDEQERITDKLDELLSDLDAGVTALEGVRAKLKHYRAAVLKAAVEGALTEQWRRDYPSTESAADLLTRILAERRRRWEEAQLQKFKYQGKQPPKDWKAKYQEPTAPNNTNLPKLPEGWCWATIDQLSSEVRNGYSAKPDAESGVPILRISAVRAFALDLEDRRFLSGEAGDYSSDQIQRGDLLFTRYNGSRNLVGVCAVVPEIEEAIVHPDKLIRARPATSDSSPRFIGLAANIGASRKFIEERIRTTAGQAGVSGSDVKALPVPLPPYGEQQAIVEQVEDQLSVIDHLEADLDAKLKSAQALRQSILRDAFEGKLVPQDPNDEPASELIKRIAAERNARTPGANAARRDGKKRSKATVA